MKASLQRKDNVINKLKTQISNLQETRSEAGRTLDFRALDFHITQLTEKDHVKPTVLAPSKYALDVETIPSHNRNNREIHLDYPRHLKESVETLREIVEEAKVVQIVLWYLDSGDSKNIDWRSLTAEEFYELCFIGTVRFGNDHFGAIMGYGDYVIGDSLISRIYCVEGLGHNLFSVGRIFMIMT
ncbi:hypothetical protein Tco_0564143 [Tanacetum coccineum]